MSVLETLLMLSTGMFIFWVCQTICFALVQERNDTQAAHAVIAFICMCSLLLDSTATDLWTSVLFYALYDLAFTPLIVSYTVGQSIVKSHQQSLLTDARRDLTVPYSVCLCLESAVHRK